MGARMSGIVRNEAAHGKTAANTGKGQKTAFESALHVDEAR
jgi:hypothetical protein